MAFVGTTIQVDPNYKRKSRGRTLIDQFIDASRNKEKDLVRDINHRNG